MELTPCTPTLSIKASWRENSSALFHSSSYCRLLIIVYGAMNRKNGSAKKAKKETARSILFLNQNGYSSINSEMGSEKLQYVFRNHIWKSCECIHHSFCLLSQYRKLLNHLDSLRTFYGHPHQHHLCRLKVGRQRRKNPDQSHPVDK